MALRVIVKSVQKVISKYQMRSINMNEDDYYYDEDHHEEKPHVDEHKNADDQRRYREYQSER